MANRRNSRPSLNLPNDKIVNSRHHGQAERSDDHRRGRSRETSPFQFPLLRRHEEGFFWVVSVGLERRITMEVFVVERDRRDSLEWVVSASGVAGRQTDRQTGSRHWTRANCGQITDEAAFEFEGLRMGG